MSLSSIELPVHFKVTHHTDHVGPGSTFYAFVGKNHDGRNFIMLALKKGATKIVLQNSTPANQEIIDACILYGADLQYTENIRKEIAHDAAKAYAWPAKKLTIIGITGTKGKTTTTLLCGHMLRSFGYKVAILCSAHNDIDGTRFPTELTTEQPDYLHAFFHTCVENNITHVVMEVAAQAVSLHRSLGISFAMLMFTNFSKEHGEFYPTQEEYFKAKTDLFSQLQEHGTIIINTDDEHITTHNFSQYCKSNIITCGKKNATYTWHVTEAPFSHIACSVVHTTNTIPFICNALCGNHNAANICMAYAATQTLEPKKSPAEFQFAVQSFEGAPGRCERYVTKNNVYICIDYAHTPSSFESILKTLREQTHYLIVLFGCGGERDHQKRPVMGKIAESFADELYITLDNPRSEKFANITRDILAECTFTKKTHIIDNRENAIIDAISRAPAGAIVALLAKGRECYQIIGTEKIVHSEHSIVANRFGLFPICSK